MPDYLFGETLSTPQNPFADVMSHVGSVWHYDSGTTGYYSSTDTDYHMPWETLVSLYGPVRVIKRELPEWKVGDLISTATEAADIGTRHPGSLMVDREMADAGMETVAVKLWRKGFNYGSSAAYDRWKAMFRRGAYVIYLTKKVDPVE